MDDDVVLAAWNRRIGVEVAQIMEVLLRFNRLWLGLGDGGHVHPARAVLLLHGVGEKVVFLQSLDAVLVVGSRTSTAPRGARWAVGTVAEGFKRNPRVAEPSPKCTRTNPGG